MHNHNNGHKGMMWMMLICCALPLILLFSGGSALFSGGYFLPILVGILIIVHLWMMFRGHGGKNDKP